MEYSATCYGMVRFFLTYLLSKMLSIPTESTQGGAHERLLFYFVLFLKANLLNSLKEVVDKVKSAVF